MGNAMPPTSTETDHRSGVLNAEPLLLSKCPGFQHQDISLIGYLNPISPTRNSEEPNFGTVYVGLGVGSSYGKHRNVEAALNLIKELNNHTKFSIGALRGHCNVAGFNQIASYLYGYPFGLDFARGYPRFNLGEYTMVNVLRDRDVDAAFVMCADLVCHIPADPASVSL
ncbi:MAG: hypothetical protein C5S48_07265 [Candidatus Methanogaster sp.]|nr:MAG: hypothetical protein C5S48_07265 [ANME-2 cluster archaeon]